MVKHSPSSGNETPGRKIVRDGMIKREENSGTVQRLGCWVEHKGSKRVSGLRRGGNGQGIVGKLVETVN